MLPILHPSSFILAAAPLRFPATTGTGNSTWPTRLPRRFAPRNDEVSRPARSENSSFIIHHSSFSSILLFHPSSLVILFLLVSPAAAQTPRTTTSDVPLSDRRVEYTIDASLDVEARTINGTQRLRWRNPDRVPVSELQFHLYLNAFKNERSTFMVESGGVFRGTSLASADRWGGIEVDRLERVTTEGEEVLDEQAGRVDLTGQMTFIQPDDGNEDDETVISVDLDNPVEPGEWIDLEFAFTSRLPEIIARTGWTSAEDGSLFVMAGQWFPKIGVLEVPGQRYVPADAERGVWSTHQFHANSEFYADFGTYDVSITVPSDFVVGATGVRVDEREAGDGLKTVRYLAEDVHDFAWTASETFLEYTDTWEHVSIRLLIRPEHRGQVERHFRAAKFALDYFDQLLGEYPYTTLTLVDGYGESNGMEYPTLITCGTFYGMPGWLRLLELVTIHEFGHQYFYGMLASNEAEEAWLDEGMNSYLETRTLDAAYGPGAAIDLPGLPISDRAFQRLSYTRNRPASGALYTRSWEYGRGDYGKASYAKPATVMNTLEGYLGEERMSRFLHDYYNTWRFRHPSTRDLQDTAERAAGEDLNWFFDQFVYGTAVVDYAVEIISSDSITSGGSTVIVRRLADGHVPIDLLVRFEDGTTAGSSWDGVESEHEFSFDRDSRIVEAFVDPENKVVLDIDRLNNRVTLDSSGLFGRKVQVKAFSWVQMLFYLVGGIL